MTIKDCIDLVDNLKPNQYTIKEKVMWLSFIEGIIINEVLKTHEGYDGRYDLFEGYSEDKLSVTLIVPSPYDRLYTAYLKMKIDQENGETTRYNNSATLYNSYMMEYRRHYNKTHMPLDASGRRKPMPMPKANVGLTDAEYENIKKDLTFILTEYFSTVVSADKVYEVVNSFVQNNMELLKGKEGYTPKKGVDYFTDDDKEEIKQFVSKITDEAIKKVNDIVAKAKVRTVLLNLRASDWIEEGSNYYRQAITIGGITPSSKIDLQPSAEQLEIFHEKDVAFVTENENGIVTVYCIGIKPTNDYVMQATITEVEVNG